MEELFDVLETAHVNVGHYVLFVIRKKIIFISSLLNFCFFLSVTEAELKKKYCSITRQVIMFIWHFVSSVS